MTKPILDLLEEMKELMELKGDNPFKIRAFDKAIGLIEGLGEAEDWSTRARANTLTELPGIGKGISEVLREFLIEGKTTARDELRASLPEGLTELVRVPGLGPKKALQLIDELGIKSLGELEYAIRENRLMKLKGFGEKIQAKIREGVEFLNQNQGQLKLSDALPIAEKLLPILERALNSGRNPIPAALRIVETGELRRKRETLAALEYLVEVLPGEKAKAVVEASLYEALAQFSFGGKLPLPVKFNFTETSAFGSEWAQTTASADHWAELKKLGSEELLNPEADEGHFYQRLNLAWIPPEMRETGGEVALARPAAKLAGMLSGERHLESTPLADVLDWKGVRGIFHNHTVESDGAATLEEMVIGAKERGYEYIGISDHSKTAVYAQGLTDDRLLAQEKEVRRIQDRHPDIRIFWGIESDILADGSLDYDDEQLKRFDFVIGSIHSRFGMGKEAMTDRILGAIRHPCTRFIGHLTGRLLLGRKGYELDFEKIVSEAKRCNVAIEINAHPSRMDIDWRHGSLLRKHETLVSVNPDAHEVKGLDDVKYGVLVARKALLPARQVINARSVVEVEKWLREKR